MTRQISTDLILLVTTTLLWHLSYATSNTTKLLVPLNHRISWTDKGPDGKLALSNEQRLLQDLLYTSYNKDVRPVKHYSGIIHVTFSLKLVQIVDVDEKGQALKTNVWVTQKWENHLLTWNPKDYGGIDTLNVDPSLVWTPTILLYNNAEESFSGGTEKYRTKVVLTSDGLQKWYASTSFASSCKINVRYFPYDEQICKLKFGSTTYTTDALDINTDQTEADLRDYITNGEWDVIDMPVVENRVYYDCCAYPFADVTFTLHIKRKVFYYLFNMMLPCTMIAGLVLLSFILPPLSTQRVTLCITVLLSMTVFLNIASNALPSTSDSIPLLAQYFFLTMIEVMMSLFATCLVLTYAHRDSNLSRLPECVKTVINTYLASVLCFCITKPPRKKKRKEVFHDARDELSHQYNVLRGKREEFKERRKSKTQLSLEYASSGLRIGEGTPSSVRSRIPDFIPEFSPPTSCIDIIEEYPEHLLEEPPSLKNNPNVNHRVTKNGVPNESTDTDENDCPRRGRPRSYSISHVEVQARLNRIEREPVIRRSFTEQDVAAASLAPEGDTSMNQDAYVPSVHMGPIPIKLGKRSESTPVYSNDYEQPPSKFSRVRQNSQTISETGSNASDIYSRIGRSESVASSGFTRRLTRSSTSRRRKLIWTRQVKEQLSDGLSTLVHDVNAEDEKSEIEDEWQLAALVLDRLFFIVFLLTIFLPVLILFAQAPSGLEDHLGAATHHSPGHINQAHP